MKVPDVQSRDSKPRPVHLETQTGPGPGLAWTKASIKKLSSVKCNER